MTRLKDHLKGLMKHSHVKTEQRALKFSLTILTTLIINSCSWLYDVPRNRPRIRWMLGDSANVGIASPHGELIKAHWSKFNEFACIHQDELNYLLEYIIRLERRKQRDR